MTEDDRAALLALPPKQQRLVHGLALWRGGWSVRAASAEAGCPSSTLWENTQRQPADTGRTDVRAAVEPLALEIAVESGKQTLEALRQGDISPQTLPIVFGVSVDKLHRLASMDAQAQGSPLSRLMELLHTGGKVTIEGPGGEATVSSVSDTHGPLDVVGMPTHVGSNAELGGTEPEESPAPAQKGPASRQH